MQLIEGANWMTTSLVGLMAVVVPLGGVLTRCWLVHGTTQRVANNRQP